MGCQPVLHDGLSKVVDFELLEMQEILVCRSDIAAMSSIQKRIRLPSKKILRPGPVSSSLLRLASIL